MAEFRITFRQLGQGFKLPAGESHSVTVLVAQRVRLTGMFFDLNKCFLLPSAMHGIREIKTQYDTHPQSSLLIVGHTDTSGAPDYNNPLSVERADAMAAYLTDQTDPWEAFFADDKPSEKRWGTREVQLMLSALPEGSDPFFSANVDGEDGPVTQAAVKGFQNSQGLKADGIAGPVTRKALIAQYMALDGTTLPAGITLTTHGCGESFPAAETEDNVRSPEDRRVEIFFFDGPITPPVPSPPTKVSGKAENLYPQWLEQVTDTVDVAAGEDTPATLELRLHDAAIQPMANASFQFTVDNETRPVDSADAQGFATIQLPAFCPESLIVEWGPSGSGAPFPFHQDILVECATGDDGTQVVAKLNNLGYSRHMALDDAVQAFQFDYGVDDQPAPVGLVNGSLPAATRKLLFDIYGNLDCLATPASSG